MESSRSKEESKTKEHITPRNGDRLEKHEQKLDRTGREGTGQSGLENAGWRSMLHWDTENTNSITLDGETLKNEESFTYLGSINDELGGSDANVMARIGKAIKEHMELKTILNQYQSQNLQYQRQHSPNVLRRTTTTIIKKVQVFINSCLHKILNINGLITSATAFYRKEQTSFQLKRKLRKDDGNG
ncbi:unnamed protein product [Schistosoma margrebowiei]|uniref:Uncharacterized protein n=1 Tax=Schistosoma margrebowiei TaxID=48269 RepID=A0A183LYZ3_9TREM|nr:unnamed protein product [Schistosoma margrebowiei]